MGGLFLMVSEITVSELKEKFDREDRFILLDVREPEEYHRCCIDGSVHIPLGDLHNHLSRLDNQKAYVVYCRSGKRSAAACKLLLQQGFDDVVNLSGGILQWAEDIEPHLEVE